MTTDQYIVEEDCGLYSGHAHPHNGYYAGDFNLVSANDSPYAG